MFSKVKLNLAIMLIESKETTWIYFIFTLTLQFALKFVSIVNEYSFKNGGIRIKNGKGFGWARL